MERSVIKKFIDTFCTQVREGDDTELIMDDHKCILFLGIEYYIPEITYNNEESEIYDYLIDNHQMV